MKLWCVCMRACMCVECLSEGTCCWAGKSCVGVPGSGGIRTWCMCVLPGTSLIHLFQPCWCVAVCCD